MKDRTKNILDDLYSIDPSFRAHEVELEKLISALLASEPDTKFDRAFAKRLRTELLEGAPRTNPFLEFFGGRSFRMATGIFAVFLLLLPFAYNYFKNKEVMPTPDGILPAGDITSTEGERAFGSLNVTSSRDQVAQGLGGGTSTALPAVPLGSPLPMSSTPASSKEATSRMMAGGVGGGSAGSADSMIVPDIYRPFSYSYEGEEFKLSDSKGSVLKRQASTESASSLITLLSRSSLNDLDIKKFQNLKIRSIDLFEDRDSGYSVNFNFSDGMISINQNWERWGMMEKSSEPIAPKDIPEKEAIISVARDFLANYGITLSEYGAPEISENGYRILTATSAPADSKLSIYPYYPTTMNVVWPLMVDGKKVYDEGGALYGVTVTVDIRTKKAVGAYNIAVNHYTSSAYELEMDAKRIITIAEKGGVYGGMEQDTDRIVKLGTPERVWMRHFQYADGKSSELLVPALAFSITDAPKDVQLYQQVLLVPLVKDLLNVENQPPIPVQTRSSSSTEAVEPPKPTTVIEPTR
jgi:hypothetical protein